MSGTSSSLLVTICLFRGSSLVAKKSTSSYAARSSVKTFEVQFSQVTKIRAGVKYTTTARITRSKYSLSLNDGMPCASSSVVKYSLP